MPPPINHRTKPKSHQQLPQDFSSDNSQQSSRATDALVPIYVHPDRLPDIEAALRYLGLPPLSNDRDQAIIHPILPKFERLDNPTVSRPAYYPNASPIGCHSTQESSDLSDLSTSFSRLSTLTSSVQVPSGSLPVQHAPVVQSTFSPRKVLKRYYVITVGKCTGVFWDEWDHVLPLVSGVSGARYKGFSTCEKAIAYYLDAKDNGLVNIVRDPGDDALFGPLHDAMQ